jgi:uncharacterized DUF497 family protein
VFTEVDWSQRGEYITAKHGVSTAEADEALNDPARLVIDPDPASRSGRSVRIIGWSQLRQAVLTVIALEDDGHEYGVNAWPSNTTDQRRYAEREPS